MLAVKDPKEPRGRSEYRHGIDRPAALPSGRAGSTLSRAKRVIISAPAKDLDVTIVLGV